MDDHRDFKDRIYAEFARVGQALASEKRLELIDLLAQAPRHVEALAQETGTSVASVSQHLQVLRDARLVDVQRQGTRSIYRLASPDILRLWLLLRGVGEERLAEVKRLVDALGENGSKVPDVPRDELEALLTAGKAILLDVRPQLEYEAGHLPNAVSIPIAELPDRLAELPRNKKIVTYCRGAYCLFADEAVTLLREHGFNALRLEGGWPEWFGEGRRVSL
jgi:rhodanese-related sulfurtransferase